MTNAVYKSQLERTKQSQTEPNPLPCPIRCRLGLPTQTTRGPNLKENKK